MAKSSFDDMATRPVSWLSGSGEHADVVLSSRVRLARNLSKHRYPVRAEPEEAAEVVTLVRTALEKSALIRDGAFFESTNLDREDRDFLIECHLISPEFMRDETPRALYVDGDLGSSLMVNEEDHLRIQAVRSGLDLRQSMEKARSVEQELAGALTFDYDSRLGYLTACPTNVGTGLRVSVLIHLPGLVLTKEMDTVLQQISKVGLAVRGFYGEGSDVLGNLFQVSNQTSLGRTEEDLVDSLEKVTRQLLSYEANARRTLFTDAAHQIRDKIWRAYGILTNARVLTSQEIMNLLSAVRLGVAAGEPLGLDMAQINNLMLSTQPAHLQRFFDKDMPPEQRDVARADLVRSRLTKKRTRRRSGGPAASE
ncbi:MAG: protein arginine kinase [candidate division Zixibacteria bacterium]|nr:protein arginine kinase [candidate division Zixibacteria bacterium]